ncbi:MAG: hypothetical protein V1720_20505 [bacterium]
MDKRQFRSDGELSRLYQNPKSNHYSCNSCQTFMFGGNIFARNVALPALNQNDFVVICDTDAYTLGMWSRYNSRQMPKVIGYYDYGEKFIILKERESFKSLYNFWR